MKFLILSRLSNIYSTRRFVQEIQGRGHDVIIENPETPSESLVADVIIPRLGNFRYEEACKNLQRLQKSTGAKITLNALPFFHQARHKKLSHEILVNLPQPIIFNKITHFPVVVKDCLSSQGEGVFLCKTDEELKICQQKLQGRELLYQEFIAESQGHDLRAFVIGKKLVASMERISQNPAQEFRSNLSLGGIAKPATLTVQEQEICIAAVERLGLDYAGVDIIRSHRGSLILEVNPCPGLEGIEKCSQANVAKEVVLYAESYCRSHTQR